MLRLHKLQVPPTKGWRNGDYFAELVYTRELRLRLLTYEIKVSQKLCPVMVPDMFPLQKLF